MSDFLTSDNPYLSRVTNDSVSAVPTSALPDQVASYVADSLAENTRRAYLSDLAHFERLGRLHPGQRHTGRILPRCPRGNAQRRDPGPQTVVDLEGTRGQRRREPGSG